ncbi:MAG: hypothetical protein QM784_32250 [Polyangiaceae bacterium]
MRSNLWPLIVLVVATACTVSERQVSIASDNGGSAGRDSTSEPRAGRDGIGGRTGLDTESIVGGNPNGGDTSASGGTAATTAPSSTGGSGGDPVAHGGSTASGGSIGSGGVGTSGGSAGSGGLNTSAGTSSQSCPVPCGLDAPLCVDGRCVSCTSESSPRCNGNVPEFCQNGNWLKGATCVGSTPVCNAGTCSGIRLVGKLSLLPIAAGTGIRLVNGQLSSANRTCSNGTSPICVADTSISP